MASQLLPSWSRRPQPAHRYGGGTRPAWPRARADRDWQAVSERARVGLDAANVVAVRVAVELGQRLQEGSQILQGEPKGSQRDVESSGNVALREDEAVPLGIIDGLRGDVEHGAVQRREDVDGGKVATDVPGTRVDQLQILECGFAAPPRRCVAICSSRWCMWQPVEDGHGDVLGSKAVIRSRPGFPWPAMELSSTSWTSR